MSIEGFSRFKQEIGSHPHIFFYRVHCFAVVAHSILLYLLLLLSAGGYLLQRSARNVHRKSIPRPDEVIF